MTTAAMAMIDEQRWNVDKRIPVASIVAGAGLIFLQTVAVSFWLATLSNRVTVLEDAAKNNASMGEKVAVIQEKVSNLQQIVNRIDQHLSNPAR